MVGFTKTYLTLGPVRLRGVSEIEPASIVFVINFILAAVVLLVTLLLQWCLANPKIVPSVFDDCIATQIH